MSTQLNYSFMTRPNLGYLVAGQTAELEFTVSNPGQPVTLTGLAFTFPYGAAGSDLCASVDSVSAAQLPAPAGPFSPWTAGKDEEGRFVLTPPDGSFNVDANGGFTFTLSVEVNSEVGVVNLHSGGGPVRSFSIEESTDAGRPGDWSPADALAKFPADFQFSGLAADPPIADQGEPVVLSWDGTAGATYTIDWTRDVGVTYAGGSPPITQSDESFPPPGSGHTLAVGGSQSVVFSVSAEYTPDGGTPLPAGPLTVTVGVSPSAPTIESFTATRQKDGVLKLDWATENAERVEIPAITSELLNPNGSFLFTPSNDQQLPPSITLTASNQGTQTASWTLQEAYLPVGSPFWIGHVYSPAVSPDGKRVYVANTAGDNTLTVLDAATLQPAPGSPVMNVQGPISIGVSPKSNRVLVAAMPMVGQGQTMYLSGMDAATLTLDPRWPCPFTFIPNNINKVMLSVAESPNGPRAYVVIAGSNTLLVLDLDASTYLPVIDGDVVRGSRVAVGKNPWSVAASPDGTRVYVANSVDNTLTVLDAATLQPVAGSPIPVGNRPGSVAVSPDSTRVYVANSGDNTLTVLDGGTLQPVAGSPVAVGKNPASVAVSPDGKRVFVANNGDNTLTVLDARTLQQIAGSPVPVDNGPWSVAASHDQAGASVYVSCDLTLIGLSHAFVKA